MMATLSRINLNSDGFTDLEFGEKERKSNVQQLLYYFGVYLVIKDKNTQMR